MRSLLNTAGCLFFLSATYTIVTIYQRSKFLHSVVGTIMNFWKQLCNKLTDLSVYCLTRNLREVFIYYLETLKMSG